MYHITSEIRNIWRSFSREIYLFLKSPRDYLYLYTYSDREKVRMEPYDPAVTRAGNRIVNSIRSLYPDLKVHFTGSAALGILGARDIDLTIACRRQDFRKYVNGLISLFGKPEKVRNTFIEWKIKRYRCSCGVILVDPADVAMFQRPMRTYSVLTGNRRLLRTYEKLKQSLNGCSVRQYHKLRLLFFHKINGTRFS